MPQCCGPKVAGAWNLWKVGQDLVEIWMALWPEASSQNAFLSLSCIHAIFWCIVVPAWQNVDDPSRFRLKLERAFAEHCLRTLRTLRDTQYGGMHLPFEVQAVH